MENGACSDGGELHGPHGRGVANAARVAAKAVASPVITEAVGGLVPPAKFGDRDAGAELNFAFAGDAFRAAVAGAAIHAVGDDFEKLLLVPTIHGVLVVAAFAAREGEGHLSCAFRAEENAVPAQANILVVESTEADFGAASVSASCVHGSCIIVLRVPPVPAACQATAHSIWLDGLNIPACIAAAAVVAATDRRATAQSVACAPLRACL